MKREKENQPIDDLFARKLGNLSLPPSADGFERLQARMSERNQKPKMVIWRNPAVQRYMAVAASLLLLCLFGWLYQSDTGKNDSQVAIRDAHRSSKDKIKRFESEAKILTEEAQNGHLNGREAKAPTNTATSVRAIEEQSVDTHIAQVKWTIQSIKAVERPVFTEASEGKSIAVQGHPAERGSEVKSAVKSDVINAIVPEQLAENKSKANVLTERVLVVTIEEPATLVATRQSKTSADEELQMANEASKETKGNGIWQQVKRFKHGELFARGDNAANNDDQGLLSRAYTGLKQSLDKGKSTKQ